VPVLAGRDLPVLSTEEAGSTLIAALAAAQVAVSAAAEDGEWPDTDLILSRLIPAGNENRYHPKEVNEMTYGFGRGGGYGRGGGGGMGFGFRGSSPPWPYVGRGRGGLPRCGYYTGAPAPWSYNPPLYRGMPAAGTYPPYAPPMSREEELNYLKDEAEAIKSQLKEVESRMRDLEQEK
jgi:hypothetical protein